MNFLPCAPLFASALVASVAALSLQPVLSASGPVLQSTNAQELSAAPNYTVQTAMVPVRDGIRLHISIARPEGSEKNGPPLPILLTRTPYGDNLTPESAARSAPELAKSGYIFVHADIRGRFGSEGQFVMNRPVVHKLGDHSDSKLVDESTDCYDTVAWLVKNIPNNNGRVGVFGVSYPGFLTMMAGIDHHPAVKAISPQAPMTDLWIGDDFFHNGALRETYAFDYSLMLERSKTNEDVDSAEDTYDYFLRNVNFAGAAAAAKSSDLPTTRMIIDQPSYTSVWRSMAVQDRLAAPEVPTLEVGGFYDQEDMWGTQEEYRVLHAHEQQHATEKVYLVIGPWNHGGWRGTGDSLGKLQFGEPTGTEYQRTIEAPFFEHYLKDKPGFDLRDTATFRTGVNKWQRYDDWPPKTGFAPAKIYLGSGGTLGFDAPAAATTPVVYTSDPTNPVPYRERPIQSTYGKHSQWRTWLASDQSFLNGRKDIARFLSQPLDRDTTVTGDIVADIFASTTGTDGDLVVKLIDASPAAPGKAEGYQQMVVDEIYRGRYLHGRDKPEPIPANKVQEYKWSLHAADHTFLKGHRIMVTVQSTWFPLYDRNPQTFVPKITTAPADAYKPATITIMTSTEYPSHLDVLRPVSELNPQVAGK